VWTKNSGTEEKNRAAVQRVDADCCPWVEELQKELAHSAPSRHA
jgi:hypothetical protein